MVPFEQILGSRMVQALQRRWLRPVEFENLAAEACPPIYSYRHLPEALSLHPDAIVLVLNPVGSGTGCRSETDGRTRPGKTD